MRFAILSPIYPYRGGIAQFSGMLYTELVKEGHEVKAFNFKRLYPDILFPGKTQYVEAGDRAIEIESVRVLDSARVKFPQIIPHVIAHHDKAMALLEK